tara:strand:+ start:365 stop:532 length:168 start_codon:yes stop_codon:yes gene_type:complete
MTYKLYKTMDSSVPNAVMTVGVQPFKSFLMDKSNPDYQQYLEWLAEGNVPEAADV